MDETNDFYENFLVGTRFWVQRVLVPLIMVIGVIGNTITIVIMTRRRMRSSTNNYLASLAIFDMLYLIFIFVLSFAQYPNLNEPKYHYYWTLWPVSLMITDACSNSSVWLTVTFTIERFIVVSHPIKGKAICTESRSRKVVFCVVLICFTYTLPTPFEWLVIEKLNPETNSTILVPSLSDLGRNTVYKSIYYWLTAALFVFVPLLLLFFFNSFLIRSVHISRKQRSDMTQSKLHSSPSPHSTNGANATSKGNASKMDANSSKQETKITVMLIAVVILFFLCQLPTAVMLIFTSIHDFPEKTREFYLIRGLNNIFNFLMAINAAGNFLLYCMFSRRYRKTFVNVFCPCLKSKLNYFQSTFGTAATQQTALSKKGPSKERSGPNTLEAFPVDGHELKVFDSSPRRSSSLPLRTSSTLQSAQIPPECQRLLTIEERDIAAVGEQTVQRLAARKSSKTAVNVNADASPTEPLITTPNTINLNSNSNYCDKDVNGGGTKGASNAKVDQDDEKVTASIG